MRGDTELLHLPEGWEGMGGLDLVAPSSRHASELHIAINADTSYKIGTCRHCVLLERGRPDRAWDADGDRELDFHRDQYFALLARLGIILTDRQAYVCP